MDSVNGVLSTARSSEPLEEPPSTSAAMTTLKVRIPLKLTRKSSNPSLQSQSTTSSSDRDPTRTPGTSNSNIIDNDVTEGGHGNWRTSCKTLRERCFHMWTNADKFKWSHDVTFEVGAIEKAKITAHRIILATSCQYFEDLFEKNANNSTETPLAFPEFQPIAFKKTLEYIYSEKVDLSGSNPPEIVAIFNVAKVFGISGLVAHCYATLAGYVTSDNAAMLFHLAQQKKDKHMEDVVATYISSNISNVFSSPCFLQLPENALCSLLNMDDWYLDEIQVFENVKRWAISKLSTSNLQSGEFTGGQIRAAMGRTFFAIRFALMAKDEFFQRVLVKAGLLSGEEIQAFAEYFYNPGMPSSECLQRFVSRPRLQTSSSPMPSTSTATDDLGEPTSTPVPACNIGNVSSSSGVNVVPVHFIESALEPLPVPRDQPPAKKARTRSENQNSEPMSRESISTPRLQTVASSTPSTSAKGSAKKVSFSSVSMHWIRTERASTSQQSPAKEVQFETPIPVLTSKESVSTQTPSLRKYVNRLDKRTGKKDIKVISETLFLTTFPDTRVHLPNLSEFRLHLEIKCVFSHGSATPYKSYVQKKTAKLDRLLFFGPDLKSLLCRKVNISLQLDKCIVFSINHKEGSLLLNLVKEAQVIVDLLKKFPLKKLAINECKLKSLEPLRRDLLETIVIRHVEGLANRVSFFKGCTSLRKVACSGFGSECLPLGRDLLFKNPHLEKVSLAKGNFWLPSNPKSLGWQSSLKELDLDMAPYNFADSLSDYPLMYPNLTKVQIYGEKIGSQFLYNILKIEALEWIFVWETELNREDVYRCGKVHEQNLTKEAKIVHKFLSKVFRSDPTSETNWPTIILTKKIDNRRASEPSNNVIFDPFDDSNWSGEKPTDTKRATIMRTLDFEHYSGEVFFQGLKRFP